ncbi:MAG: hypothetical protein Q8Q09_26365 [Deltaproteobacteria bacterium]|nr:hypothetical protein [Deltaproteobacteria bacterium]
MTPTLKTRSITVYLDAAGLVYWVRPVVPQNRLPAVVERLLLQGVRSDAVTSANANNAMDSAEVVIEYGERSWVLSPETLLLKNEALDPEMQLRVRQDLGAREIDLRWPADASPREVVQWLETQAPDQELAARICALIRANFGFEPDEPNVKSRSKSAASLSRDQAGERVRKEAIALALGGPTDGASSALFFRASLAARAFVAWRAIERDLARPVIAVDATQPHHELMSGWRDLPKNLGRRNEKRFRRKLDGDGPNAIDRLEILAPDGRAVQLTLPYAPEDNQAGSAGNLQDAVIRTLQQWQGAEGIRHWAVMQRLLSVEGGRTGSVRWSLEAHLNALGYAERNRRDPEVRKRVAAQVEMLTRLELAVYAPDGKLRARAPLITATTKYDALHGSEWSLEGMELRVNSWLYRGVRNPETGELGTAWYPAPVELAQIDHSKFPYAIVLGLILPMRWRWDLGRQDYCILKGASLLSAAGIRYSKHDPKRSWDTLRNNLDELQTRGGLGHYEWDESPWTLDGACRLYPPQLARERTLHGLRPHEVPPPPSVLTGEELVQWRSLKGWSQSMTARELGVSLITIKRAERNPKAALGPSIRKAILAQH